MTPERGCVSRRMFARTLAAAAALLPVRMDAQNAGRIDVHHHFTPPFYVKAMEKELAAGGFNARPWTPEISLEAMDRHKIATALLSPVQRLVMDSMSDRSRRARSLARQSNEFGAQVVRDHPGRFGLLAALPLPDTEGSLHEIEYAFDTLKADGIALWTSYLDKWPGDPAFAPVFAELDRRKAVVFFHPATANCCRNLIPGLSISGIIEYDLDTARAAESLLVNGTPARFPNVRFILSHSGGALPVLAARIIDDYPKNFTDRLPKGAEYEIRRFYYEVAHGAGKPGLDALKELVPVSQILFGSDVPIRNYELTTDGLDRFTGFSGADRDAINRGNAERLFPRLKAKG
ncbi:MAG TPA: amidohydrolase family protein [Bryobacteraceae bacterium]|nr:amidohydrolase family protein [Bryobacteraceae bacterium]